MCVTSWFYFFQSKFQFHIKFFCTIAKHPLSSPETKSSFFSFFRHFAGNLFGFSARPLNLTCFSLSLERIHFLLIQTYIPVFYMPGTGPDSRETKMLSNTEPPPSAFQAGHWAWPRSLQAKGDHLDSPSAPRPWSPYSPPRQSHLHSMVP